MANVFLQSSNNGDIDKLITGDVNGNPDVNTDKILTIDLENCSYRTFQLSTIYNIETLNINNSIMGSQAVIFIYTSTGITINGLNGSGINELNGTGIKTGYDTMTISAYERIVMTICSTGTNHYINLNKFA